MAFAAESVESNNASLVLLPSTLKPSFGTLTHTDEIAEILRSYAQDPQPNFSELDTKLTEEALRELGVEVDNVVVKPMPGNFQEARSDVFVVSNGGEANSMGGAGAYIPGTTFDFCIESHAGAEFQGNRLTYQQIQDIAGLTKSDEFQHFYSFMDRRLRAAYPDTTLAFRAHDVVTRNAGKLITERARLLELGDTQGAALMGQFTSLPPRGLLPISHINNQFVIWRMF